MDSVIKSLLRGRVLATVTGAAAAGLSGAAAITGALNEATAVVTALLALISSLAALYSKIRELDTNRDEQNE